MESGELDPGALRNPRKTWRERNGRGVPGSGYAVGRLVALKFLAAESLQASHDGQDQDGSSKQLLNYLT